MKGNPDQCLRNGCRIDLRAFLKVEALRDSCRSSKALLLRCHLPIGALPFSRFLLGTGDQLAANRFGRSNPTKQALLHRRSKIRDRVRSLIVIGTTLAGNATSVVCQAPPVEAPVEPQCQRSPLWDAQPFHPQRRSWNPPGTALGVGDV
jgi:hypothetical protein